MLERQSRGTNTHSRLLFSEETAGKESSIIGASIEGISELRKKGIVFMLEDVFSSRAIIDRVFGVLEEARNSGHIDDFQREFPELNYAIGSFEGTIEESFGARDERYYRISYGEKFDGRVILDYQQKLFGTK